MARNPGSSLPHRLADIASYAALGLWSFFVIAPLYWIVAMSFKKEIDIFSYPPRFFNFLDWTLGNYKSVLGIVTNDAVISTDFPKFFLNSLIIVGGAMIATVVFGSMAAYALARMSFRGRETIAFLLIFVRMIPVLTILLPMYVIYRNIGLYNTYPGLIIIYLFIGLPFFTWLLRNHIAGLPRAIEEAAYMDGCSTARMLTSIVLPIAAPGILSAALLVFIYMWNSFIFALVLAGPDLLPVTTGLLNYLGFSANYGALAAACVITTLPAVLIGILIQKYIVGGLSAGAVKG